MVEGGAKRKQKAPRARGRAERLPLRARARAFVFDGQAEHERFGIFDPMARWSFMVSLLVGGTLLVLSVVEAMGPAAGALSTAVGVVIFVAIEAAGFLAYRRVWVPPQEREILLQMAAEEDESRALLAAKAKSGGGTP